MKYFYVASVENGKVEAEQDNRISGTLYPMKVANRRPKGQRRQFAGESETNFPTLFFCLFTLDFIACFYMFLLLFAPETFPLHPPPSISPLPEFAKIISVIWHFPIDSSNYQFPHLTGPLPSNSLSLSVAVFAIEKLFFGDKGTYLNYSGSKWIKTL